MNRQCRLILLVAFYLVSVNANAKQTGHLLELLNINKQIAVVKKHLTQDKYQLDLIEKKLQHTELAINTLSKQVHETDTILQTKQKYLQQLQTRKRHLNDLLDDQRQALAEQVNMTYRMGRTETLRILVTQDDPRQFNRILNYYYYLNKNRKRTIKKLNATLATIKENSNNLQQTTRELTALQAKRSKQQQRLLGEQVKQQRLAKSLNQTIQTLDSQLVELEKNKGALGSLVKSLASGKGPRLKPFASMKRKLAWPTQGTITKKFASPYANSKLRWNGVLIKTDTGRKVNAIYVGKVIFSNWMRGFGLLIIIDHGDGYMSLYAHNQNIYKNVGDSVNTGETIATAGHSGGYHESGLYFEIRHNGNPVNPSLWINAG